MARSRTMSRSSSADACLTTCGYRHGPLFRAADNGTGELLRYQSVHEPWRKYAATAGAIAAIYQLRHSHATELEGISRSVP